MTLSPATHRLLDDRAAGTGWLLALQDAEGDLVVDASAGTDPDGTFRCASVTKSFTASAVLRLVEEGRLTLEQPIGVYGDALRSAGYDPDEITVERLLRHTSGLPDHASDAGYEAAVLSDLTRVWTRTEQVQWALDRLRPVSPPGRSFSYSDTGYLLLGALLEEVTGVGLGTAVRQLTGYEGLGCTRTWWELLEDPPLGAAPRLTQRYEQVVLSDAHPSNDLFGGGGLLTCTRDLVRFFRCLLDGRVLRPGTLERALTLTDESERRGLGLLNMPFGGGSWWGHTGFVNVCAAAERGTRGALCLLLLTRSADTVDAKDLAAELVGA